MKRPARGSTPNKPNQNSQTNNKRRKKVSAREPKLRNGTTFHHNSFEFSEDESISSTPLNTRSHVKKTKESPKKLKTLPKPLDIAIKLPNGDRFVLKFNTNSSVKDFNEKVSKLTEKNCEYKLKPMDNCILTHKQQTKLVDLGITHQSVVYAEYT